MDEENKGDAAPSGTSVDKLLHPVGWFRQLHYALRKNVLLLSRQPVKVSFLLLTSVVSSVLAWLTVRKEQDERFEAIPLTECGTIDGEWFNALDWEDQWDVPISYNNDWRNGSTASLLACGPMFFGVVCFLIVHAEFETQMMGVLRGLGLRESVYWVSWWIPFSILAFVNAVLGAMTTQFFDVHAFQNIYFGGVLAAYFFLTLALVGASFFLVALCGSSKHGGHWLILLMFIAVWIPLIIFRIQGSTPVDAYASIDGLSKSPSGLFWINGNTATYTYEGYNETSFEPIFGLCEKPLVSEAEGNFLKTEEEKLEVSTDEYFIGCYFGSGYTSSLYNPDAKTPFGLVAQFMFPYTHFVTMWSNYLGYTSMPNREFKREHASMSAEELAVASMPVSSMESKEGDLVPQMSTLVLKRFEGEREYYLDENPGFEYDDFFGPPQRSKSNCPGQVAEGICGQSNDCTIIHNSKPAESPSTNSMKIFQVLLAVLYSLLAAYWSQVFPGKNGAPQKYYFFLLPSYWKGARQETVDVSDPGAVVVDGVRKSYGAVTAVNEVSLRMARGEVTALLGHNGAGKTTLSHILCCETGASDGDATIFGYSVSQNPSAVRNLVGVCKQDDYLYPNLSAREHLELFAGLRGVASNDLAETVQKWLESVDLGLVDGLYTAGFSGGMKRRLSVACATIGGRPFIVLDEPTTGMDPVSRRFVWRHVDEIKDGRVVLLTTHAMEEADLLSDMVAIMRKGDVAALGTPLELKAEYGSALRFNILVGRTAVAETKLEIEKKFPSGDWVEVDAAETGNITVTIKQISQEKGEEGVDVEDLTNFVAWLESDDSHVDEYGFSNSSLEEVFLKVTAGDIEAEDEDAEELDVCCPGCNTGFLRCCLRGPCRCCCCPRSKRHSHDADEEMLDEVTQEVNGTELVADIKPTISLRQQVFGILLFSFQRSWTGKASIASWIIYGLIFVGVVVVGISGAGFYDRATAATAPTTALSLILINVSSLIYSDRRFGLFYLMRSQGLMASSYLVGYGLYAFLLNLSIGFVFLLGFFVTPLFRDPQECPDDQWGFTSSCYQWGERTPADRFRREFYQWNDTTEDGEPVTVFLASRVGGAGGLIGALFCFAYAMPGAIFASTYMPGHRIALVLLSVLILGLSVTPLILYFILNFGKTEEELNECRWDICNTTLSSFNIDNVGQHGEEFLNCMGLQAYGYDSIGGLCLPAVTGLIPQFGLFQTIAMTLMAGIEFTSDPPEYADQVLMPKLGGDCDGNICRFPFAKDLYYKNIGFMLIGGMLLLVVGLLLVFTFTFPVKPVLAVKGRFTHAWRNLFARKPRGKTSTGKSEDDDGPLEEVISESEHVQSVLDSMPQNDSPAGLPPVLTHKLRKVYPSLGGLPPKVALDSLDLHVPKGQVLGLLGKNGAGKTSVLKILSVAHEADDGLALIAGYNVATEQINVFEHLGNCQQFDVVWSSKSVQSHLEFFAQLKGIPRAKVKSTAHSIASSVGLGSPSVYRRTAGALSGGMRRRLSIGISLIGAPDVLLLDEPTTGLDPSTRNSIWGLLNSFSTVDRAIVITTHMMVEADSLCNRIAIMSEGKLKVVATQQRLKDRFGSGYLLQLNLVNSTEQGTTDALAFVRENVHPGAILQTKQAKTLHIALPRDLDLRQVFTALYSKKSAAAGGINQFLLSQSSLEDVFLALGD